MQTIQSLTPEQLQIQSLQQLVEVMGQTNQQLGLITNPYGVMVAALSVLFTVLAITFAFILWRQGEDYRKSMRNFFSEQRKVFATELKIIGDELRSSIDKMIAEKKDGLDELQGELREKAEKDIEELTRRRKILDGNAILNASGVLNMNNAAVGLGASVLNVTQGFGSLGTSPLGIGNVFSSPFGTICKNGHSCDDADQYCRVCGAALRV